MCGDVYTFTGYGFYINSSEYVESWDIDDVKDTVEEECKKISERISVGFIDGSILIGIKCEDMEMDETFNDLHEIVKPAFEKIDSMMEELQALCSKEDNILETSGLQFIDEATAD